MPFAFILKPEPKFDVGQLMGDPLFVAKDKD